MKDADSILYFAYGSNLVRERLVGRVGDARVVATGRLAGRRVVCNKRGHDGSAKANLVEDAAACAWGALYALAPEALDRLDPYEGGYERVEIEVETAKGAVRAVTYVSLELTEDAVAFDWYRELCVTGARAHRLPDDHVAALLALPVRGDPRRKRP